MTLLKLNGVGVQVTASEWTPVTLGEVARALNGAPRSTARVKKRDFRYTTGLLTVENAALLRALIEGEGHVLSFEDTTTATAWQLTSGSVAPVYIATGTVRVSTGGKWGAYMRITVNDTMVWPVLPSTTGPWTVLMWRRETSGGPWVHYLFRSDEAVFRNGVLDGTKVSTTYVKRDENFTTSIAIKGTASGNTEVDDVVFLPYLVPDAWVPDMYAFHNTRAWPALPAVWAEDPRMPAGGLKCLGQVGDSKAGPLRTSIAEVFDFTLHGT